jgi:pimeloyl-ACP methyl ester carboxylesterase
VTAYASLFPVRAVVNVDQPLALVAMQTQVQQAAPMLRGDGLNDFFGAMFGQMYGALEPAEVTRLSGLRQPNQEAVLGMWSPLLDLAPEELGTLVKRIAVLPSGTPYLSLHGLDAGPGYAAWLTSLIPSATIEVWGEVPTHYPHLVDPARFVRRIQEFTA